MLQVVNQAKTQASQAGQDKQQTQAQSRTAEEEAAGVKQTESIMQESSDSRCASQAVGQSHPIFLIRFWCSDHIDVIMLLGSC